MYSCKRLGDNITEFRYASADGGGFSGSKGSWTRAAVAVTGASLFVQVRFIPNKEASCGCQLLCSTISQPPPIVVCCLFDIDSHCIHGLRRVLTPCSLIPYSCCPWRQFPWPLPKEFAVLDSVLTARCWSFLTLFKTTNTTIFHVYPFGTRRVFTY